MKTGYGLLIIFIVILISGCAYAKDIAPEYEGVRVLMRYDFDIQEYASVDSAQREMERWVQAYKDEAPDDGYSGVMAFEKIEETEGGYRGYLDCGGTENFGGMYILKASDATLTQDIQLKMIETATGNTMNLDTGFLTSLPATYQVIYGPVECLLMGADQIVIEVDGTVRYSTAGWLQEGNQITADPVILYQQEEVYFAIVYEPEDVAQRREGTRAYSWVIILAVGIIGIAGLVLLSRYQGNMR